MHFFEKVGDAYRATNYGAKDDVSYSMVIKNAVLFRSFDMTNKEMASVMALPKSYGTEVSKALAAARVIKEHGESMR